MTDTNNCPLCLERVIGAHYELRRFENDGSYVFFYYHINCFKRNHITNTSGEM